MRFRDPGIVPLVASSILQTLKLPSPHSSQRSGAPRQLAYRATGRARSDVAEARLPAFAEFHDQPCYDASNTFADFPPSTRWI
jgi:hypothetical protein